jgi:hypothetical protein
MSIFPAAMTRSRGTGQGRQNGSSAKPARSTHGSFSIAGGRSAPSSPN